MGQAFRESWKGWEKTAVTGALSTLRGDRALLAVAAAVVMAYRQQRAAGATMEQAAEHAAVVGLGTALGLLAGKATGTRFTLAVGGSGEGAVVGGLTNLGQEGGDRLIRALGLALPEAFKAPEGSDKAFKDRFDQTQLVQRQHVEDVSTDKGRKR